MSNWDKNIAHLANLPEKAESTILFKIYSLRSFLIDSDLVQTCTKFESIKKERREYMLKLFER
jgi:hypothetical protein